VAGQRRAAHRRTRTTRGRNAMEGGAEHAGAKRRCPFALQPRSGSPGGKLDAFGGGSTAEARSPKPCSSGSSDPSLAGSWQISLTPTSAPIPIAISGLATFTAEGSMVETDITLRAYISSTSAWWRVRTDRYTLETSLR
jgi:hypothetical protein